MLKSNTEQLLIIGSTDTDESIESTNTSHFSSDNTSQLSQNSNEIRRIKRIAERIINDQKRHQNQIQCIANELKTRENKIIQRLEEIESLNIVEKYQNYVKLDVKVKLLCISKYLKLLSQTDDVLLIPDIVFNIVHETKQVVLPSSVRIRQELTKIAKEKSKSILTKFHELFELQIQESTSILNSKDSEDDLASKKLDAFLMTARDWLLSYTLVTLLPYALSSESQSQCIDKYQEVIVT